MDKNNLSPEMQARLDKWRSPPLPVQKTETFCDSHTFVARRRDYGDDISDIEKRKQAEWNTAHENNKGLYGTTGK